MSERANAKSENGNFRMMKRKVVSLSQQELVKSDCLAPGQTLPLVLEPQMDNVNLAAWAAEQSDWIESKLSKHGAILFRDFRLDTVERFEEFARAVTPSLLDYRERSSPRSEVKRGIYTSTDYPNDESIRFHNEQSYTRRWPMKLWFYCRRAAEQGGATPIADGRRVLDLLDAAIKEKFVEKKAMYVRNYGDGMGLSWQTAFQTADPAEVENYCRRAAIECEWKGGDRLRTRQIFDTIVVHPKTGERVWFEHAAFFHVSSLKPVVSEALLAEFSLEDLPSNTYYGDGSPIEPETLEAIHEAYRQTSVRFSWRMGDVLLIDNMLTSHGREPFAGERRIVVAMAELFPEENN